MTSTAPNRSRTAARRGSYLAGVVADVVLLVLVNVSPGWRAVPVLTDAAAGVVVAVDVALAVALVVNLLCLVRPQRSLTATGDLISTTAGLVAVIRTLHVFPFAFSDPSADWTTVARATLISIIVVVSIALVVQLVVLVRVLVLGPERG